MMRALYLQGLRRLLARPVMLIVIVALMAEPLLSQALGARSEPEIGAVQFLIALVASAGLIGNDFHRGEVRLILTRPVPRWLYLVARWLAAGTASGAFVVALYLLGCVTSAIFGVDGPPSWQDMLATCVSLALWGFVFPALLLPLSVLLPGEADACIFAVGAIAMTALREFLSQPLTQRLIEELYAFMTPRPEWLLEGPHDALAALSNAAIALLLACFILTRRELPSAPPA